MNEINYSQNIQWRDYLASQYLHLRPRPAFKRAGIILIVLYTVVVVWLFCELKAGSRLGPFLATFLALWTLFYILFYFFVLLPYQARKTFNQNKFLHHQIAMRIDETGIHSKSDLGESHIPWDHIAKWKENDKLFLLYIADRQFFIFSKKAFSTTDLISFTSLLTSKVVKKVP